jgi:hypothetical protein
MTRLINDFLDLTKIEAGCTDWRDSEVDVETLANEVLLNAGALALEGDIQLIQAVEPNLPKLHMDGDRLMQVLTNLMNNAIKHTPSGGSITLRASVNGRDMQFAVDDTGPGIPAEEAAKLFDRFRQVRNENTDGKKRVGTGLGLAISREIVQHYGGRIWIESEVGHGSSFCFTLPLQRDDIVVADGHGDKKQNGNGGSARVLILLDDLEEAKNAARLGMAAGLECRTCTTVEEVIALRDKWTPDAYVVSVNRLQSSDALLACVRSDAVSKLLVYSSEHGLTAPSLLDSAELLVPSLRGLVSPARACSWWKTTRSIAASSRSSSSRPVTRCSPRPTAARRSRTSATTPPTRSSSTSSCPAWMVSRCSNGSPAAAASTCRSSSTPRWTTRASRSRRKISARRRSSARMRPARWSTPR